MTYVIHLYIPSQSLRSSEQELLMVLRFKRQYGKRSFRHLGPEFRNQLPHNIRTAASIDQFKTLLKTHLFNCVYGWFLKQYYKMYFYFNICNLFHFIPKRDSSQYLVFDFFIRWLFIYIYVMRLVIIYKISAIQELCNNNDLSFIHLFDIILP